MSEHRNRVRIAIYSFIGIAIVAYSTFFVCSLIVDLWRPPFLKMREAQVNRQVIAMKSLGAGLANEKYDIGHKASTERALEQRFHNWEIPLAQDVVSPCITCHGDVPHDKNEVTRAFLNKHNVHLSCEVCHIDAGKTVRFVWYNVNDGSIKESIPLNSPLITSEYKVVTIRPSESAYNYNADKKAALELLDLADKLSIDERRAQLKPLHNGRLETPLECRACHTPTNSAIPFKALGYTDFRAQQVISTEVVGMVENYKMFYLPTFITNSGEK